jgi:O-antigen ligase
MSLLKNFKDSFFTFSIKNIFLLLIISRFFFIINLTYIFYISIKNKFFFKLKKYNFFRFSFLFFTIFYITGLLVNIFIGNSLINQLTFFCLILLFFFSFYLGYYLYLQKNIYISFSRLVLYFNIFLVADIFLYRLFSISIFPFVEDIHNYYGNSRYAGVFLDRKVLGGYLCVTFPLIYNYLNFKLKNIDQIFTKNTYFYILIYFIAIVLTGDRRPSFIFGIIFIFYYLFQKKNKINLKTILIFLFAFIFIYLIFYLNVALFNRVFIDTLYVINNYNNFERGNWFQLYHISFDIITYSFQNFMIGVGSKNFTQSCIEIGNSNCSTHPHNLYVEAFVNFGIVGFSILCICIYKYFKFLIKLLLTLRLKDRFNVFTALFIQVYFLIPFLPSGSLFAVDLLIYYSILNSIVILNLLTLSNYYDFKKK